MVQYKCEKCKQVFKQKSHYTQHLKRKRPCEPPVSPNLCVMCGEWITEFGHNPFPLADSGRVCDDCNMKKVIPARFELFLKK